MKEEMYILIAKALSREATPEELRELQQWLDEDAANKSVYEDMKRLWSDADDLLSKPQFEVAPAWEKVAARTVHASQSAEPVQRSGRSIPFPKWGKMLAAAAVFAGIFIGYRYIAGNAPLTVIAAADGQVVTLPDHSTVRLKKGSVLTYPEAFTAAERQVSLEGEGFFEVTRNERQPFVVMAYPVDVKVLGTSFNVRCKDSAASVAVATGKVQVTAPDAPGAQVILLPGNAALYQHHMFRKTLDTNAAYYKTGRLPFADVPLDQAMAEVAKVSGADIRVDVQLPAETRSQLLTAVGYQGDVEAFLRESCQVAHGVRWEQKDGYYFITTK